MDSTPKRDLLIIAVAIFIAANTAAVCTSDDVAAQLDLPEDESPVKWSARTDAFGDPLPRGAVARLGTMRFRHAGGTVHLSFSPDGRFLVSSNGYAQFWDLTTGKLVRTIRADSAHFLPDGSRMILLRDRRIQSWDLTAGREVWSQPHQGTVQISADGSKVLAIHIDDGSNARGLRRLDAGSGNEIANLETQSVHDAVCSPDGKYFAGGRLHKEKDRLSKMVEVWSLDSGERIAHIKLDSTRLGRMCFSADGRSLIFMEDAFVEKQWCTLFHIWSVAENKEVAMHKVWGGFKELTVSPDGKLVITVTADDQIELRRFSDWRLVRKLVGHLYTANGARPGLAFSPDGATLAVAEYCGRIRLWDIESGLERFHDPQPRGRVNAVSVSPDGRVVFTASDDGSLRLWNLHSGIEAEQLSQLDRWVSRVDFSRRGNLIAGHARGRLHIWERMQTIPAVPPRRVLEIDGLRAFQFAPDGKRVWTFTNGGAEVWPVDAGATTAAWKRDMPGDIEKTAISPDLSLLAFRSRKKSVAGEVQLEVRDVQTGKLIRTIENTVNLEYISDFAFSPAGKWLVYATNSKLIFHDLEAGKDAFAVSLSLPDYNRCIAFSPDGRLLATTTRDDTKMRGGVALFEVSSGKQVLDVYEPYNPVTCLAFSPNGQHLVTGHMNTTSLVWDLALASTESANEAAPKEAGTEELWVMLADGNPARACRAAWRLAGDGDEAVSALTRRLRPAGEVDHGALKTLIGQLDSDEFEQREVATEKLTLIGVPALADLKRAIATTDSSEVRKRARQVVGELERQPILNTEQLRILRAIAVLERIGTAPARELLLNLSKGEPSAEQTIHARAALDRLAAED